jgi:hypothetical protein
VVVLWTAETDETIRPVGLDILPNVLKHESNVFNFFGDIYCIRT